ncbi:toprim domain-containing protein [Candidatus Nitrosotenuis chungbukensis]|uniref:toprim domain-containing protein n=1 Tax=Candidatus Nitrosotenuis chungbukensis TaxID=1353246 RepID=UPI0006944CBD|nr:toprim domain-containing protein [Candidatus Nitrosotenuis chungbukensis]WKT57546.1 toprim domain-containing protein [Candidatus Nitrosotenuis chungbukensis]
MQVIESEIYGIREFIDSLNSEKESAVIVEGKRDSAALKKLGFTEKVLEFHRFGGLTKFADSVSDHKNLILLFDSDRKGKYLTRRVIEQLEHRTRIDLSYKKKLAQITKGKVRTIEELDRYGQFLYGAADHGHWEPKNPF